MENVAREMEFLNYWLLHGIQTDYAMFRNAEEAAEAAASTQEGVTALHREVAQLKQMVQLLILLQMKSGKLTDADFKSAVADLEERMRSPAGAVNVATCAACSRPTPSNREKCIYCGVALEAAK